MRRAFLIGLFCTLAAALRVDTAAQQPNPAPMLARTGDVVYVALTDAKGAKLVADLSFGTEVNLWRKCGKWVSLTPAWLDWENSRVVCGGFNDRGLEPAEYTLACRAGQYGAFEAAFTLEQGKPPALSHKLETWRRVITLAISGQDGAAVPALPQAPYFEQSTAADAAPTKRTDELPAVLREKFGFQFRKARGGGPPPAKYLTYDGKWHIAVAAGKEGKIRGPFLLTNTFDDAAFDKPHAIRIQTGDWATSLAKLEALNATDPGQRALVAGPQAFTPVQFVLGEMLEPELSDGLPVARGASGWDAAVPRDRVVKYRIHGGPLFTTPWLLLPEPGAKSGAITVRYSATAARLEVEMPGQTASQCWDWCHPSVEPLKPEEFRGGMVGPTRVFTTFVDDRNVRALREKGELNIYTGGAADREPVPAPVLPWPRTGRLWRHSGTDHFVAKLAASQITQLVRKQTTRVTLNTQCLAFRVVTATGKGVPLAQASIIRLDQENVATRLKEREAAMARKGTRPSMDDMSKAISRSVMKEPEEISDDDLKEWLGAAVYDDLGERDLRLRYARHGAWYDTGFIMGTDCHGYAIKGWIGFEEKTKYVLYVWGSSRDDLKPDLRVEFTFKAGGADLGALVVPDYS